MFLPQIPVRLQKLELRKKKVLANDKHKIK